MQAFLCNGYLNEFMRVRLDTKADASALDCMAPLWRPDIMFSVRTSNAWLQVYGGTAFFLSELKHKNFQAFENKLSLLMNLSLLMTEKTTYQNCPISLDCV